MLTHLESHEVDAAAAASKGKSGQFERGKANKDNSTIASVDVVRLNKYTLRAYKVCSNFFTWHQASIMKGARANEKMEWKSSMQQQLLIVNLSTIFLHSRSPTTPWCSNGQDLAAYAQSLQSSSTPKGPVAPQKTWRNLHSQALFSSITC